MKQPIGANSTPSDQLPDSPSVVVWRDEWLPASETFIYNQLHATQRWRTVPLGLRRIVDGLPIDPLLAPFNRTVPGRVAFRIASRLDFWNVYDRRLRRHRVQVIHAHFGTDAVTVLPIARRAGLPLVVTFHGSDVTAAPRRPGGVGDGYMRDLRQVFDYSSALIAVSHFIADTLRDLGAPPDKIMVAPIGIPVNDTGPIGGSPEVGGRTGITFVGRLVAKKGVADLLEAVIRLPRSALGNEPIRIVGYGPLERELREIALGAKVPVQFMGRRNSVEIAAILRSSRIFCAPSRTADNGDAEGFGMVFLEAALQGLPVASYRHGGVPEAVSDGSTGLLASEGDVDELSANLLTLLEDADLCASMGATGRDRVIEEFDVAHRTLRLQQIYDDVTVKPEQV